MSLRKNARYIKKPECFDKNHNYRDSFRKEMNGLFDSSKMYSNMIRTLNGRYFYSGWQYHIGFAKIDLKDKDK